MTTATQSLEFNAKRIKRIRVELGLSQQSFSNRLGVSMGSVGNWERGRHLPTRGVILHKLLQAEREAGLA